MARNAVVSLIIKGRDRSRAAVRGAGAGLSRLKSSVLSLNSALVAIGVTASLAIGKKLVTAFGTQERAILRVKQSLANAGIFSDELTAKLERNAAALQRVTQAGDEAILEGTATVADLAKELTGGDFLKVQEAMIALADTFFEGNVRTAATMLAKTLGSSTNALARYGVEIDTTATQQEKLNQILAITGPLFLTSKAAATDILGVTAQLSNSIGDLQEAFGGIIVSVFDLRVGTDGLRGTVDGMTESIQENESTWINWGKFILATIRAVGNAFLTVTRLIFNGIATMVDIAIAGLAKAAEGWFRLIDLIPGIDLSGGISTLENLASKSFSDIASRGEAIADIGDKAEAAWANFARTFVDAANKVEGATSRNAFTPDTSLADRQADEAAIRGRGPAQFGLQLLTPSLGRISDTPLAGLPSLLTKVNRDLQELVTGFGTLESMFAGSALDAVQGFGGAISDAFQAGVDGSIGMAEAFTDAMLAAISTISSQWADFYFAKAAAALGEGFLGTPGGFAAAAKFALAGAAFSALAGITAGIASGGGGIGGSAASSLRQGRDLFGDNQGTLTLILEGDETILDHNNPRAVDRFARMMERASGRRVVVRRT